MKVQIDAFLEINLLGEGLGMGFGRSFRRGRVECHPRAKKGYFSCPTIHLTLVPGVTMLIFIKGKN